MARTKIYVPRETAAVSVGADEVALAGLHWVFMITWPGEIAEGGGKRRIIIDERADEAQRDALLTIVSGEGCAPGSNHFFVFGSMCSEFIETLYLPVEYEIDIPNRTATLNVPGVIEARGNPIVDDDDFCVGNDFFAAH